MIYQIKDLVECSYTIVVIAYIWKIYLLVNLNGYIYISRYRGRNKTEKGTGTMEIKNLCKNILVNRIVPRCEGRGWAERNQYTTLPHTPLIDIWNEWYNLSISNSSKRHVNMSSREYPMERWYSFKKFERLFLCEMDTAQLSFFQTIIENTVMEKIRLIFFVMFDFGDIRTFIKKA